MGVEAQGPYRKHRWLRVPRAEMPAGVRAEFVCQDCPARRRDRDGDRGGLVHYLVEGAIERIVKIYGPCPRLARGTGKHKSLPRP